MNYLPQANLLTIESQNASTVPHTVTLPDYMTLEYSTSTACERPLARVCPDNRQYTVQDAAADVAACARWPRNDHLQTCAPLCQVASLKLVVIMIV